MADSRDDDKPPYTLYRAKPKFLGRRGDDGGLREMQEPSAPGGFEESPPPLPKRRRRRRIGVWRVVRWLATALVAWLLVSLVLFLVSAQVQSAKVSDAADTELSGGGYPLTAPNTILVLGSDARVKGTKEAGAQTIGQRSRSDSILLVRIGGGHNATLSIPRDTVVNIPGSGQNKINAAYAIGGPSLAIRTVEAYLGIQVNHLVEVNFENFPQLIDAMGGITYHGGCVVSRISGGSKNGGYTLRLKKGKTHINGKQALALARTRHNDCNKAESDLTRARRQQKILSAMKSRLLSPFAFPRMPFIAWNAPKALRSDMSGPTLLGLFGALATSGSPAPRILKPDGPETAPDGGAGLHVSDAEKTRDVKRFLKG
jgi:LCP family protein required for cell wall assembly